MIIYFGGIKSPLPTVLGYHPCGGLLGTFADTKEAILQYDLAKRAGWSTFLDSGAYSAFTQGEVVDPDSYADFLDVHGRKYDAVASLDVIGDAAGSARNHKRLLERGHDYVIPTFHYSLRWDELKLLCDVSPRIALGGMARFAKSSTNRRALMAWLDAAFKRIPSATRVHGFGVTGLKTMADYPWDSVDSTTAVATVKRGYAVTGRGNKVGVTMFSEIATMPFAQQLQIGASFAGSRTGRMVKQGNSERGGCSAVIAESARALLSAALLITENRKRGAA